MNTQHNKLSRNVINKKNAGRSPLSAIRCKDDGQPCIQKESRAQVFRLWRKAITGACLIVRDGDERDIFAVDREVSRLIHQLIRRADESDAAGYFVFIVAQICTERFMQLALAPTPPTWVKDFAQTFYEIPWLMTNGKPAPGFKVADEKLMFGNYLRRGKSSFGAKPTEAVAATIGLVRTQREEEAIASGESLPIVHKTVTWHDIKEIVRTLLDEDAHANITLTLKAGSYRHTDAAVKKEWLKRCKRAFRNLRPSK